MKRLSSEIDLRNPEKYHLKLWKYLGLIPPKAPGYERRLYICYSIFVHVLFTLCCPLTTIIYIIKAKTFAEFCQASCTGITIIGASVKFSSTLLILPRLKLVSEVTERLHNRAKSDDELLCLKEAMRQAYSVVLRIFILFTFTVICSELASLVVIVMFKQLEPAFVLPAWFPLDWQHNRTHFKICYTYQMLALFFILLEFFASDTYIIMYIQNFIGHVMALSVRVKKIGEGPKTSNSPDTFLELVECIKDHQQIIRMLDFIQGITNASVFIQFISTSISQITFGYFVLSSTTLTTLELVTSGIQFTSITLETCLPCYYGEKIRTVCDDLAKAIYNVKWYDQDLRFRRCYLLFLQRAQKEECLMAGNQIPVTLRSFFMVILFKLDFYL